MQRVKEDDCSDIRGPAKSAVAVMALIYWEKSSEFVLAKGVEGERE